MRITSKGQVTIPIEIREQLGLLPDTEVEFSIDRGGVRMVKATRQGAQTRGSEIVRHMRGRATSGLTTDAILRLMRG